MVARARIRWSAEAVDDLTAIHDYIARDSPRYAAATAARLVGAVDRLRTFPESGRIVPELGDPAVREVIYGNYRIMYEVWPGGWVDILTVLHAAREFRPLG